jgi:hypothetical protein
MTVKSIQDVSKTIIGREYTENDLDLFRVLLNCFNAKRPCKSGLFDESMDDILNEFNDKGLLKYDYDNVVITAKLYGFILSVLENTRN